MRSPADDVGNKDLRIIQRLEIAHHELKYTLWEPVPRTIIFVGRSLSGKTRCIETLISPTYLARRRIPFSESTLPACRLFAFFHPQLNQMYNITIFDTPGLFEITRPNSSDMKTNHPRDIFTLSELIRTYILSRVTRINGVFFVFSYGEDISIEDIDSLEQFLYLFKGGEKLFHFLVTHTEDLSLQRKNDFASQLLLHPRLGHFLHQYNVEILFIGAVSKAHFENGWEAKIYDQLTRVIEMRDTLLDKIVQLESCVELNHLTNFVSSNLDESHDRNEIITLVRTYLSHFDPLIFGCFFAFFLSLLAIGIIYI